MELAAGRAQIDLGHPVNPLLHLGGQLLVDDSELRGVEELLLASAYGALGSPQVLLLRCAPGDEAEIPLIAQHVVDGVWVPGCRPAWSRRPFAAEIALQQLPVRR